MKVSQFTLVVADYPDLNHQLLYHTLSKAMIVIDKDQWDVLLQTLKAGVLTDNQLSMLLTLKAMGFLVPKGLKEGERYLHSLSQSVKKPGGELVVTLLTNLQRCPLACSYCYQEGTHTGGRLESDLSKECLAFIKDHCLKLGAERLFISYYGSEPLSNKPAIVDTATELKQFSQEKGIRFRFGMVTSGVLLTRQVVEQLLPLGFVTAQITIDGNQQTHDASRPFQSGKGTYSLIMKHLSEYAGLIQTTILCVVDETRVAAAYELIDTLAENGYAQRQVSVTFSPVMPTLDDAAISGVQFDSDGGPVMMAEKEILVELAKLSIYAAEKGLIGDLRPKHTWCAMQRHDGRHLVLDPSGKIYTCAMFIGREQKYEAGDIKTKIGGIDTVLKAQYFRSEKCLSCRYLPICADCRYDALSRTGQITASNPKQEIYDLIVPELLKAHHRLSTGRAATSDTGAMGKCSR